MKTCAIGLLTALCAALAGCSAWPKVEPGHWPLTPGITAQLGRMPRADREAWFHEFGLPEYRAHRREGTIVIDGILDEPAWRKARAIELLTTDLGARPRHKTAVRMLWDDEAIYIAFECDDPDVHAPLTNHDDHLWKHDVVEVFIDTDGGGMQYMELHAAPSRATADILWADFDPDIDWYTVPVWKHHNLNSAQKAFFLAGGEMAVRVDGTLNYPDDTDKGYVVEWRIPFAGMRKVVPSLEKSRPHPIDMTRFEQVPVERPVVGAVWRMNFNRCDDSVKRTRKDGKGGDVSVGEYTAWSPPIESNQMPFRFGIVRFVE